MKKKYGIFVAFAFLMVLLSSFTVLAESPVSWIAGRYLTYYGKNPRTAGDTLCNVEGEVKNLRSSNPAVLTAMDTFYWDGHQITALPHKPGVATISFEIGNQTYKKKFVLIKYRNPVESLKLGNTSIPVKKFNKPVSTVKYRDFANKTMKVKLKLRKNWKLSYGKISYQINSNHKIGHVKNGGEITVSGGKGFNLYLMVKNKKTGRIEFVDLDFV